MYEFVSGDTVIKVSATMKVHHFKIDNTVPTRTSSIPVDGTVIDADRPVPNLRVQAFQVSDLAKMRIVLVAETKTDLTGSFSLDLEEDQLYILKAGVDETMWRSGGGPHGGTVIDLHFPEDAHDVTIPLEHL